jgi:hypothetical protein
MSKRVYEEGEEREDKEKKRQIESERQREV